MLVILFEIPPFILGLLAKSFKGKIKLERPKDPTSPQTLDSVTSTIATEIGVALYFSTINCGVCTALKPKVEQLMANKFPLLVFNEVNSNTSPEIAAHFGVFSAPTLLVFFEGKEFSRNVRNMSVVELDQKLSRPYKMLTNAD